MMNTPIDHDAIQFLHHMEQQHKTAAMVVYGFMTEAGPVLRVKSNQPGGPTQGILKVVAGTDEQSIEVAARAIASALGQAWDAVDPEDRDRCKHLAHVALEAARGRLLQTIKVSERPDDAPGAPVVEKPV